MAWRSSGTSNESLASTLKRNGLIESDTVYEAFCAVDRAAFLPEESKQNAYEDAPVRNGHFHMSAPHMYASALEELDLKPGQSFLNVGSGTGYLSAMVGYILSGTGMVHGVEIYEDLVHSSTEVYEKVSASLGGRLAPATFVLGNAFDVTKLTSMSYDRIYVGAAACDELKQTLKGLLNVGGLLVGPFEGSFMRISRDEEKEYSEYTKSSVMFAPLIDPTGRRSGFDEGTPTLLSLFELFRRRGHRHAEQGEDVNEERNLGVREERNQDEPTREGMNVEEVQEATVVYAPPFNIPEIMHPRLCLSPPIWDPSNHEHFPTEFRRSAMAMLCFQRRAHDCIDLPLPIILEVLGYCSRTWFERQESEVSLLRAAYEREHTARKHAEEKVLMLTSKLGKVTDVCIQLLASMRDAGDRRSFASRFLGLVDGGMDEEDAKDDDESSGMDEEFKVSPYEEDEEDDEEGDEEDDEEDDEDDNEEEEEVQYGAVLAGNEGLGDGIDRWDEEEGASLDSESDYSMDMDT